MKPSIRGLILWFVAIACIASSDDPKLVEKREQQKAEIIRLKGELTLIEEKLKNMPPDMSVELDKTNKEAKQQATEVAGLEAEVAALQARKRSLQDEFDSYRVKYPIK